MNTPQLPPPVVPAPPGKRKWYKRKAIVIPALLFVGIGIGANTSKAKDTADPATTVSAVTQPVVSEPPVTEAPTTQVPETVPANTEAPATTAAPVPIEASDVAYVVSNVVDGDTVDVTGSDGTTATIRVIGIDTPEGGQCGSDEATFNMAAMALHQPVTLTGGARDDVDKYGRLLRYVDVNGVDTGDQQIKAGLAIARYDSRDGYGAHTRETQYVRDDAASSDFTCAPPVAQAPTPQPVAAAPTPVTTTPPVTQPPASVYYPNCAAARAAGAAPLYRGDPGYSHKLDRDNDGVACE